MTGRSDNAFTPIRTYAWVILLARAILALGLGVVVVATNELHPSLANVIGVYWFLGALLTLRWARAHPHATGERFAYGAAVAGFVAALVVFARTLLANVVTEEAVFAFLGTFCVIIGLLRASGMFRESVTEEVRRSRPETVVLGILEIALGIVLLFGEDLRPWVVPIIGTWGLLGGGIMLSDAIRAWRVFRRPLPAPTSAAPPAPSRDPDVEPDPTH